MQNKSDAKIDLLVDEREVILELIVSGNDDTLPFNIVVLRATSTTKHL